MVAFIQLQLYIKQKTRYFFKKHLDIKLNRKTSWHGQLPVLIRSVLTHCKQTNEYILSIYIHHLETSCMLTQQSVKITYTQAFIILEYPWGWLKSPKMFTKLGGSPNFSKSQFGAKDGMRETELIFAIWDCKGWSRKKRSAGTRWSYLQMMFRTITQTHDRLSTITNEHLMKL